MTMLNSRPMTSSASERYGGALVHDILDGASDQWPESTAVRHDAITRTFAELRADSIRIAGQLRLAGVRRGDRVIIAEPTSVAVPAVVFACSRLGAVFVFTPGDAPLPVIRHILTDSQATVVVTSSHTVAECAALLEVTSVSIDDLIPELVDMDNHDADLRDTRPIAVDPVCFIYTSGTTALPKAVVSTHQQVVFAATAIQSRLGYRSDDVVFCALPLSFDYGMYQILLTGLAGATLHLGGIADAGHRLVANLQAGPATVLVAVPSLATMLNRLLDHRPTRLDSLRLLTNTGAAMPPEALLGLRAKLPSLRVQLMYGLTECKRGAIMPPDGDLERPGSCGIALPGTRIFAADEHGHPLPPGEVGELVVQGPNVMSGYWRQPALTAERFPRAGGLFPQLRTGDYGYLDGDGYIYFAGRRDDIYKQNGTRVSTVEIEAAAHRVTGVRAAAVVLPTGADAGAVLVVQGDVEPAEVLAGLRARMELAKQPELCLVVESLPLTSNGKVDRRRLTDLIRTSSYVR